MVTVEIPRKTLQKEYDALVQRVLDFPEAENAIYYLGAIQVLVWLNDGGTPPSEMPWQQEAV
jgi:hypothetical protein